MRRPCVLTEARLQVLFGIAMQRVCFEHDGREVETLVPVLKVERRSLLQRSSGHRCSRLLKPTRSAPSEPSLYPLCRSAINPSVKPLSSRLADSLAADRQTFVWRTG